MRVVRGLPNARALLCEGRGLDLDDTSPHLAAAIERMFGEPLSVAQVVDHIIAQVRSRGDDALRELAETLDGARLDEIRVPPREVANALDVAPPPLVEALELAAGRIAEFHEASLRRSWFDFRRGYGELVNPVERVGVYVPGGTALYPSTLLMAAVPARVAGVREVIVCTPTRGEDNPHPALLAAARLAGVDGVYRVGGAQAIAAMAYGTESVPRVDLICGPGNLFVTLAKKRVYGDVGIDGLYGPTETMIIADDSANPTLCAVDLLAQAEHDALAKPVLATTSERLASAVLAEVQSRLVRLDRTAIAAASVNEQGCVAILERLDDALELANEFAPEHVCLMIEDAWTHVGQIKHAGAVFVGEMSHEVLGDYVAGPSHIMPTAGTARFNSGVGVHTFLKTSPILALDDATAARISGAASIIARVEGLTAHAEAAEVREELS